MITKKIFAWGMYDLANTIYSALFVTFFFPLYVKNYLGGTEFMIGAVFAASMLLVGLCVPALGALSDLWGKRKPSLITFTILNCILVALVPLASLPIALALALLANFCYHAALNVYNALLPDVSDHGKLGQTSAIGVGMGYLGTLLSLATAYLIMDAIGWNTLKAVHAMFYTTSTLFLGLSLITFFGVREFPSQPIRAGSRGFRKAVSNVQKRLSLSIPDILHRKPLRSFLVASFCFTNAMNAVIIFLFLYGQRTFGLTVQSFFPVYTIFALGAAAGSFILGRAIDRHGPSKTLALAGWTWIVVVLLLAGLSPLSAYTLINPYALFIFSGILGGAALGLVWASNRPLLVMLAPKKNLAEYFGFLELTDKFSGVLGPLVFGFLATYHGYGTALISLLVFFCIGLWFLRFVKIPQPSVSVGHTNMCTKIV